MPKKPDATKRTLIHFEAVDYRTRIYVNGHPTKLDHLGGNVPFSYDISEAMVDGENELIVRVEDATGGYQLRGKQFLDPHGIWYTRVSGIWQTVWLEEVPQRYIDDLHITTDAAKGTITIKYDMSGPQTFGEKMVVQVKDGNTVVATATTPPVGDFENAELVLTVPNAKLWSPTSPFLYGLEVSFSDAAKVVDSVKSYAGIRTVGKTRDADGNLRFTLNGEIIFHWGPLDQGWWPDGLLTPPSDAAMAWEIQFLKDAGFNMIRKHIKVEPRRYYYHCDKIGMMVWQDQVSALMNPPWTRLKPDPKDADWPIVAHTQYMTEFEAMVDNLENHPSIVVWVPFNEAWGQHQTVEVGKWIQKRDPTRLVNIASGRATSGRSAMSLMAMPIPTRRSPWIGPSIRITSRSSASSVDMAIQHRGIFGDADRDNWGYGGLPKTQDEYKQTLMSRRCGCSMICVRRESPAASTPRRPTWKGKSTGY